MKITKVRRVRKKDGAEENYSAVCKNIYRQVQIFRGDLRKMEAQMKKAEQLSVQIHGSVARGAYKDQYEFLGDISAALRQLEMFFEDAGEED